MTSMDYSDLVSIIMPCYNNEQFVARAIHSALTQTYPNLEVIVVDDGSTDGSARIIDSFQSKVHIIRQKNLGACAARNKGLQAARGKWIKFLDADDILNEGCIAAQVNAIGTKKFVVFGDYSILNDEEKISAYHSHLKSGRLGEGDAARLETLLNSLILTSTTLYPASILKEFGGFNVNVRRGQEHELHLRLFMHGVDFRYFPFDCYQYRQHATPSRISVARRGEDHFHKIENFRWLINMAKSGPRAGQLRAEARLLAQTAWRIGRRRLRSGEADLASTFFTEAVRLAGRDAIYGSIFYRMLARSTTPKIAEDVSAFVNLLRRNRRDV